MEPQTVASVESGQPINPEAIRERGNGNHKAASAKRDRPHFHSERLVIARRRLAMSQGELAKRLGVDQSTVSRLERGEMQSPPWKLVIQACLHLQLEPHALMDTHDGPEETCLPLSIVRARVSHHFLHLGKFSRLPEMLHYCLHDMSHVRPTIMGLSLMLFDWPDGVSRHFYAHWQTGEVTFAELTLKKPLAPAVTRLREQWDARKPTRRTARPELPGWSPELVLDIPLTHGLLGLDFLSEEANAPDTDFWADKVAETFDHGLALVGERHGRDSTADLRDITARLMALEQKLH